MSVFLGVLGGLRASIAAAAAWPAKSRKKNQPAQQKPDIGNAGEGRSPHGIGNWHSDPQHLQARSYMHTRRNTFSR